MNIIMNIGPSFPDELKAAGLFGKPFSFGLGTPGYVLPDPSMLPEDVATLQAVMDAHDATKTVKPVPPDCGSLAFWLTALDFWQRTDHTGATGSASSQVEASISALIAAKNPLGFLAQRQFNNANTVVLTDLVKIAPAFGFTEADCEESLWRANQIALGDYRGLWPLPADTTESK